MKNILLILLTIPFIGFGPTVYNDSDEKDYKNPEINSVVLINSQNIDVCNIYGRIKIVDSYEDFRVKIVDSYEDVRIKQVDSYEDSEGRWKIVDSYEDYRIKIVDSYEDFRVKMVDSYEGCSY